MKKKLIALLALSTLIPTTSYAGDAGDTKLETVIRARNTSVFDSENEYQANYSSIERGYLTVKHNMTDNIKGRVTLDIVSKSKKVDDVELAYDGASVRLKYAFIDFANALGKMGVNAGLGKNYFGMTRDMPSSFIYYKAGAEKWFSNPSADYGLTIGGKPIDILEFHVQGVNGNGYKKVGKDKITKYPDLIADVRVTPIKPLMLGLSYKYDKAETGDTDNSLLSPVAKIKTDYIDIPVESVINLGEEGTFSGNTFSIYVQPEVKLKKIAKIPLSVGGGFGYLANEVEEENSTVVMGGLKYDLVKGIKLQASYVKDLVDGESEGADLMFQVEYKFSKLLN